ncbi:DUF1542 domain-containing protein [Staphylococcus hominis]
MQDATTEEKEAAKAKVDQAVTKAKGHINEAINNSGVDEAKTNGTTTINAYPTRSNQKIRSKTSN